MVAPRLPNVGGDDGNWGTILNDYLSQSRAEDGSLDVGAVGAMQLKSNTVTSDAIARRRGADATSVLIPICVWGSARGTGAVT